MVSVVDEAAAVVPDDTLAAIAAPACREALARIAAAGFDVLHAFDARAASAEPGWAWLADVAQDRPVGVIVGNTRRLWPVFSAALPALAAEAHPLDHYTERAIEGALEACAAASARVVYAHQRYGDAFLPFQRLAVASGLAALAPSQLLIHPTYGPWFAVRALLVVDGTPPVRTPVERACAEACARRGACARAFAAAQTTREIAPWIAVRDACSLRAWRYDDEQIAYHYERAWPTR